MCFIEILMQILSTFYCFLLTFVEFSGLRFVVFSVLDLRVLSTCQTQLQTHELRCYKLQLDWSLSSSVNEVSTCEVALWRKAKQTGRPSHKDAATQETCGSKTPPLHTHTHKPTQPHVHPEHGAKRRKLWRRRRGASSDTHSLDVTSSQRRMQDTATKSQLMDCFLNSANTTREVCVSVCEGGGGKGAYLPHLKMHMGK